MILSFSAERLKKISKYHNPGLYFVRMKDSLYSYLFSVAFRDCPQNGLWALEKGLPPTLNNTSKICVFKIRIQKC